MPIANGGTNASSTSQGFIFAGPVAASGAPSFRAIVSTDLPANAYDSTYFKQNGNSFGSAAVLGTSDNNPLSFYTSGSSRLFIGSSGNIGVGISSPTARLMLPAGSAIAGSSPLKMTAGTVLTAPEAGAVEFDGANLYFTDNSNIRRTLGQAGSGIAQLTGDVVASGNGSVSAVVIKVNGVAFPASPAINLVPVVTGTNTVTYQSIPNVALQNSSTTVGSTVLSLGGTANTVSGLTSLSLGINGTTTGILNLSNGAVSGATTTLQASPSTLTAWSLTLPSAAGPAGSYLQTSGSGITSWVTPAGTGTVNSALGNQLAIYSTAGSALNGLTSSNNSVLLTNGTGIPSWNLSANDNFTQYANLNGRAGGQTWVGGTGASENVTINSTSSSTKGYVNLQTLGGNVGIGTTSPAATLHVLANSSGGAVRIQNTNSAGFVSTDLVDAGGNNKAGFGWGNSSASIWTSSAYFNTSGTDPVILGTNNLERLRVSGSGNIGIGTTLPQAILDINGSGTSQSAILVPRDSTAARPTGVNGMLRYNTSLSQLETYSSGAWSGLATGASAGGSSQWTTSGANIYYNSTGNVGIGTTGPGFSLDVQGTTGVITSITQSGVTNSNVINVNFIGGNVGGTAAVNAISRITSNSSYRPLLSLNDVDYFAADGSLKISGSGNSGHDISQPVIQTSTATTSGYSAAIASLAPSMAAGGGVIDFVGVNTSALNGGYFGFKYAGSGSTNNALVLGFNLSSAGDAMTITAGGNVGVGTTSPQALLDVYGTGVASAMIVPRATIAQRPTSPVNGMIRYQLDTQGLEAYIGGAWTPLATGAGGGASQWVTTGSNISYGSGNVGIGTTSPQALLDIYGTGITSAMIVPRATVANRPTTNVNGMIRYATDTNALEAFVSGGWTNLATAAAGASQWTTNGSNIYYGTGNVGIGTTTPAYSLHAITNGSAVTAERNDSNGNPARFWLQHSRAGGALAASDQLGEIAFSGYSSSGYAGNLANSEARIWTQLDPLASITSTSMPTAMYFDTKPNGSATSLTRMAITSSGNVGIGTTNASNKLHVAGSLTLGASAPTSDDNGDYGIYSGGQLRVRANASGASGDGSYTNLILEAGTTGSTAGNIIFNNLGNESLRVTSSGNVGIGTTSPQAVLDVNGSGTAQSAMIVPRDSTAARPTGINGMLRYNTTNAQLETYSSGAWAGLAAGASGSGSNQWTTSGANIYFGGTGSVGINTATPISRLDVYNLDSGAVKSGLHIYTNGAAGGSATPEYGLRVDGDSSNGASVMYGVYARAHQNVGGASTGLYGESAGSINSNSYGLYAKSVQPDTNGPGIAYGVYSAVSSAGANTNGKTYAGYFDNQSVSGATAIGLYVNSVSGALNSYAAIFNGGSVGVGTTSPQALLDVYGTGVTSAIIVPRATVANRPTTNVNGMIRYATDTNALEAYVSGAWTNLSTSANGASQWTTSGSNIYYGTGNVGVGTAAPQAPFETYGSSPNLAWFVNSSAASSISGAGMSGFSAGIPTAADQRLGFLTFGYLNGSNTARNSTAIQAFSSQSWTDNSAQGSYLTFSTTPNGVATRAEAMRIDQAGNVGIGNISPGAKLDVTGNINLSGTIFTSNLQETTNNGIQFYSPYNSSNPFIQIYGGSGAKMRFDTANHAMYPTIAGGWDLGSSSYPMGSGFFNNNVGIGTLSPQALLDVYSVSTASSAIIVPRATIAQRPTTPVNGMIRYQIDNQTLEAFVGGTWANISTGSGSGLTGSGTAGTIPKYSSSNGLANSIITDDGSHVGIGTNSTAAQLNVNGDISANRLLPTGGGVTFPTYGFGSSNTVGMYSPGANQLGLSTNSLERLHIDSTGNIGIGTSSPVASLDLSARTDAVIVPTGTTAQRPTTAVNGMVRYNSDLNSLETYAVNAWQPLGNQTYTSASINSVTTTSGSYTFVVPPGVNAN